MYGQAHITTEIMEDLKLYERIKKQFKKYFGHEMPECSCDNPEVEDIGDATPVYPVYICRNCGREL